MLPAGPAYLAHVRRAVYNHTFEEADKHAEEERKRLEALHSNGTGIEDDLGVGDEEETEELLSLDPKEWKVRASAVTLHHHHIHANLRIVRAKITTLSSVSITCGTRLQMNRSKLRVGIR